MLFLLFLLLLLLLLLLCIIIAIITVSLYKICPRMLINALSIYLQPILFRRFIFTFALIFSLFIYKHHALLCFVYFILSYNFCRHRYL